MSLGPAVAVVAQVLGLAVLDATVGLGPAAWVAGTATAVLVATLLARGLRRAAPPGARRAAGLGAANAVTLARSVLVGLVTALAADSLTRAAPVGVVVGLAVPALLLDAVDGVVARRAGAATALGARFDMEVDALLILVLSVLLVGPVGPWVLAIGLMRYAFVVAAVALPWLGGPLLPRFSRKVVAAGQGVALVVAVSGVLPAVGTSATVGAALAALCWSFGRDVRWLLRIARAADGQPSVGAAVEQPEVIVSIEQPQVMVSTRTR
ncbi:MAG: CDP-alcohol phosphatidyltransferase family protein [Kineosporiaceae bacterium]|jgi:phosphatidylglycerophosphate synthase